MTSLAELKAIEAQRIAGERSAAIDVQLARVRERDLALQREREAEAARVAAEREAEIQIARDREQAERQARMHVEAAEATERARLQAAIEHERIAAELELRRAEVAKKRPTWMIAVTLGAVLAAGGLTWFAVDRQHASEEANQGQRVAELEKTKAVDEAADAARQLARIDQELGVLGGRVDVAIDDVMKAQTTAERLAARSKLDKLQQQQAELRQHEADAKAKADHLKRIQKVEITEECKKNALARNCLK